MSNFTDDDVTADRPDHDYCAWCGWSRVRDDSDEDALLLHIMECPKHPLRFGSSKRDAAIAARTLREATDVDCDYCRTTKACDAYRRGRADALREAADEIADSEVPIYYPSAWLRARAEQVNP